MTYEGAASSRLCGLCTLQPPSHRHACSGWWHPSNHKPLTAGARREPGWVSDTCGGCEKRCSASAVVGMVNWTTATTRISCSRSGWSCHCDALRELGWTIGTSGLISRAQGTTDDPPIGRTQKRPNPEAAQIVAAAHKTHVRLVLLVYSTHNEVAAVCGLGTWVRPKPSSSGELRVSCATPLGWVGEVVLP